MKRIFHIQQQLTVQKTEQQSNYTYRTLPATLKALLPLLADEHLVMTLPCISEQRANGTYIIALCQLYDETSGEKIAETSYVTLDQNPMIKGGQGTGAAATYAKKGAIDSMFLLDANNPDLPDLDNHDQLQKIAESQDNKFIRDYETKVAVVIDCLKGAKTIDEIKKIRNANPDAANDERVVAAGRAAQDRATKKTSTQNNNK